LYLHLYEPSSIEWKQGGIPLKFTMNTRFPFATDVACVVKIPAPARFNLRVRTPSWAMTEMSISVNGQPVGKGQPGSYFPIDREWADGDRVEFALPIGFRVTRYSGADQLPGRTRYAFEYGPTLYAVVGSEKAELPSGFRPETVTQQLEAVSDAPMGYRLRGHPGIMLMPYWQISTQSFTCFPAVIDDK
jgi:DUF1680 family protein